MATTDDFLPLERQFWTGDADFYRENLDDACLVAFTQMSGLYEKEDIAKSVKDGQRWSEIDLAPIGFIEPAPGVAILTYEVHGTRSSGEDYAALVSSGYVKRNGSWKMAFHQHTPLAA
jgi:hypothetical protein